MDLVEEQLRNSQTIAVVGLSDNPDRFSYRVAKYLQDQGYRIIVDQKSADKAEQAGIPVVMDD